MLLKEKLKEIISKRNTKDKIKMPVMDGFVDVKGYKDGKLIYHDCGDNVVTDWMRQAIITMLAGVSFTAHGDAPVFTDGKRCENGSLNPDGYCFNGKQYNEEILESSQHKYCSPLINPAITKYATFPTKILFGTGKEYTSWAALKSENEANNPDWFQEMINLFGNGIESTAQTVFDGNIALEKNDFSGTITGGVYSGDGYIAKCRTVNDPDTTTTEVASAVSMYRNYNVVGAVKTPYTEEFDNTNLMLTNTVSETGKLLKPAYRGVGKPAFIYFNQHQDSEEQENWNEPTAEVYISKETDNKYLTKITFTINLPEQSVSTNAAGVYYPYNGYTLKQIGLYNDSQVVIGPGTGDGSEPTGIDGAIYPNKNMQHGTLLAVKNISPFTKTSGSNFVISWTLTI